MKVKNLLFAGAFVLSNAFSMLNATADPSRVFWSATGTNLGLGEVRDYAGSSVVRVMTAYKRGVLAAFTGPQAGLGNRIHWSPDGKNLGSGELRYDGSSPVTAMMPYGKGVLVAFANAGGNGNRIWFSPDGKNLGGGELRYDGSSPVTAMIPYGKGVLVAFANAGGNGNRIWFSPDGKNLGGGELRYDGSSPVTTIIPYKRNGKIGVLAAFSQAGPNGNRIHWSQDGKNIGSGEAAPYYDGSTEVTAMLPYKGGVFTAFLGHGDPDPNACPLPSVCVGLVLICRTGKQRGAQCAPDKKEACGICVGGTTP